VIFKVPSNPNCSVIQRMEGHAGQCGSGRPAGSEGLPHLGALSCVLQPCPRHPGELFGAVGQAGCEGKCLREEKKGELEAAGPYWCPAGDRLHYGC